MKKMIYLTVSVLLIAAGVSWLEREPLATKVRIRTPEKFKLQRQAQEVPPQGSAPPKETFRIQESELREFRRLLPLQEELKEEVRLNPHQTPPALLLFAGRLGELMDLAEENSSDRKIFLKELEDCALDENAAATARALCVSNAEKLGHASLRWKIPPFIRNLVKQKNNMLINKYDTEH